MQAGFLAWEKREGSGGSEIAIDSRPDREAISPLYCGADPRARSDDP